LLPFFSRLTVRGPVLTLNPHLSAKSARSFTCDTQPPPRLTDCAGVNVSTLPKANRAGKGDLPRGSCTRARLVIVTRLTGVYGAEVWLVLRQALDGLLLLRASPMPRVGDEGVTLGAGGCFYKKALPIVSLSHVPLPDSSTSLLTVFCTFNSLYLCCSRYVRVDIRVSRLVRSSLSLGLLVAASTPAAPPLSNNLCNAAIKATCVR
jgi:hypothetical protein